MNRRKFFRILTSIFSTGVLLTPSKVFSATFAKEDKPRVPKPCPFNCTYCNWGARLEDRPMIVSREEVQKTLEWYANQVR